MKRRRLTKCEKEAYVRAYKKWITAQQGYYDAFVRVEQVVGKKKVMDVTKELEQRGA